jgi:excisionase family DNA binding protein
MTTVEGSEHPPTSDGPPELELMLTASEVARLFRVSAKTVGRWGRSGALPLYRTVGGHHRYRLADVRSLLGLEPEVVAST